jgi:cation:H+ antiporter
MIYDIGGLIIAFAFVAKGGDMFVDSSIQIASTLRVPRIIIGGTLVSLATTIPELVVSVTASYFGDSGIALGNAVGSAIVDMGLVTGTVALILPVTVDRAVFRRRAWWVRIAAILLVIVSWNQVIGQLPAFGLFLFSCLYLFADYRYIRHKQNQESHALDDDPPENGRSNINIALRFILGAVLIVIGSRLLLDTGISLATKMGVPSIIIGLSVVAMGTSLPELVTGISAARKGVPDLSVGNVLGANLLNIAMIVGLAGTIRPLILSDFVQWYSYPWLFVFIATLGLTLGRSGTLDRRGGIVLIGLFIVYATGLASYGTYAVH